jgi:hypothetical protein
MKKPFIAIMILVIAFAITSNANSQSIANWIPSKTGTLIWDASPVVDSADQPNQYKVVWRPGTDFVSTGTQLGTWITTPSMALIIPDDVKYMFGVSARRMKAGVMVGTETPTSWSSDPAVCQGGITFGLNSIRSATLPGGLRLNVP